MKSIFKNGIAATLVAALGAAVITALILAGGPQAATAQSVAGGSLLTPSKLTGGGWATNRVAGSTAFTLGTNAGAKIDVSRATRLSIGLQANLVGAGTTDYGIGISRTVGGNTNREMVTVLIDTASGTTPQFVTTNLDVGGYDAYFVEYITNYSGTGTSYLTNWIINFNAK
jgi:hypothetical protein